MLSKNLITPKLLLEFIRIAKNKWMDCFWGLVIIYKTESNLRATNCKIFEKILLNISNYYLKNSANSCLNIFTNVSIMSRPFLSFHLFTYNDLSPTGLSNVLILIYLIFSTANRSWPNLRLPNHFIMAELLCTASNIR